MWRHGDIMIERTEAIPEYAKRLQHVTLAYGEVTGHSHRIEAPEKAVLWQIQGGDQYLKITQTTRIIHEEHHPITLEPGLYRVWHQREYTPRKIIQVRD
jgi:hypothetical protein